MFDWLKKTAQNAAQSARSLGAKYVQNQELIEQLVVMPEAEMLDAFRQTVTAMDDRAYIGFTVVLGVLHIGARAKVQQVAPEHTSQHSSARPIDLPIAPDTQQAIIRLRKLEMLSSYGNAYRRGDSSPLPEPTSQSDETVAALKAELTVLIEQMMSLPEARMLNELREAVLSMDGPAYTGFSVVLDEMYTAAKRKVEQVASAYVDQNAGDLPADPDLRQAVIRLRKLEMLASYGDAYHRGEAPILPETIWTVEHVNAQIETILTEFETTVAAEGQKALVFALMRLGEVRETFIAQGLDGRETYQALYVGLQRTVQIYRSYMLPEDFVTVRWMQDFADELNAAFDEKDPVTGAISEARFTHIMEFVYAQTLEVQLPDQLKDNLLARLLAELFEEMCKQVVSAYTYVDEGKNETNRVHQALLDRCQSTAKVFPTLTDLEALNSLARGTLLSLGQDSQAFSLRQHLTIASPIFSSSEVKPLFNSLFYSGGPSVENLIKEASGLIGMGLAGGKGQANLVNNRWDQLRSAHIAVFDFTLYNPAQADPQTVNHTNEAEVLSAAGPVASVAYELGWAFVLGLPTVIVAREGQRLPFDVDVKPVEISGSDEQTDVGLLLGALLRVAYLPQRVSQDSAITATTDYARATFSNDDNPKARALAQSLNNTDFKSDPLKLRFLLEGLFSLVGNESLTLCTPVFPGSYPKDKHLFYVTGFRPWAEAAQQATQQACARNGVFYQIGYDRIEQDIIRVIWNDICGASHLVVDITNLNPNAVQELGMAHILGRKTLILTQNRAPHTYFPAISKIRTHFYDPNDAESMAALGTVLDRFLGRE